MHDLEQSVSELRSEISDLKLENQGLTDQLEKSRLKAASLRSVLPIQRPRSSNNGPVSISCTATMSEGSNEVTLKIGLAEFIGRQKLLHANDLMSESPEAGHPSGMSQ